MNLKRLKQVVKYGWLHSVQAIADGASGSRVMIFLDIISCFRKYKMWSNQYLKERFYALTNEERATIGAEYYRTGKVRDEWQRDFVENRKFLNKYMNFKYEIGSRREKRRKAYIKQYGIGKGLMVEYDVHLSRQHYLPGTISIGNNILLAKHVFIDYSGEVIIKDGVRITAGVMIESHHAAYHSSITAGSAQIPNKLVIEEGAFIGVRAIVMSSCHYIGKHARVGAGAIVTKDVPDYAVVVGSPAKVIRYLDRPEDI